MNPPVDAPTSSAVFPKTSTSKTWSAFSSLSPPRLTYRNGCFISMFAFTETLRPGLEYGSPSTSTSPARISRFACSRLSTSSRSARSVSRRCLFGLWVVDWAERKSIRSHMRNGGVRRFIPRERIEYQMKPITSSDYPFTSASPSRTIASSSQPQRLYSVFTSPCSMN